MCGGMSLFMEQQIERILQKEMADCIRRNESFMLCLD
jgi:hypothetical protein